MQSGQISRPPGIRLISLVLTHLAVHEVISFSPKKQQIKRYKTGKTSRNLGCSGQSPISSQILLKNKRLPGCPALTSADYLAPAGMQNGVDNPGSYHKIPK